MNSVWIVEGFDVLKHTQSSVFDIGERVELRPLMFERPEESFHHRVVVAASGATHRACDVHRSKNLLVLVTRVLASSTRQLLQSEQEVLCRWSVCAIEAS